MMCRLYGVTPGGYYAWRKRPQSARAQRDAELVEKIRVIHSEHDGNYGSPRVHGALSAQGERLGEKRVARLMKINHLRGKVSYIYRKRAGTKAFFTSIPNRELEALADAPNRVWVGDVTYLRLGNVWQYLAVVMDKHSRRVLSWALKSRRDVGLTLDALELAVHKRRPGPGVVFHSDRGSEYGAEPYRDRLTRLGMVQSMNRPSRMNDNAHMESFFHSMKSELYRKLSVATESELRKVIATYIEYYNERRGHTSIGNRSPAAFEALRC